MKKILSGLLVLVGVFMLAAPSYAGSIYYTVPLWQHSSSASLQTIFSVTSLGSLSDNKDFASTGATVSIKLYNNVLAGSTNNWTSATIATGSLWATINRTFASGYENFMADTSNQGTGVKWATSSGWSSSSTSDLGYALIEISSSTAGSTPSGTDFSLGAWMYGTSSTGVSRAGFPLTVGGAIGNGY